MNQNQLKKALSRLPLGDVRYFDSIGSTNNEALAWATSGAQDLSLVIADEQTAGRGRLDRKWFTPKGTALALSLILRPTVEEKPYISRVTGLAALAITDALRSFGPGVKREQVLRDILAGIIALRPHLKSASFIVSWEKALAFRGEQVQIEQ